MLTDSDDDFVEVSGYQSSDSEWEKVGYGSSEEEREKEREKQKGKEKETPFTTTQSWPHPLVASYYPQDNNYTPFAQGVSTSPVPAPVPVAVIPQVPEEEKRRSSSRNGTRRTKEKKSKWTKVTLKQGQGAPLDPVEFLGITRNEKAILAHFGITTIGQLADFNALDVVSTTDPDNFAVILDLQERAYKTVMEYIARTSSQPEVVWGYVYLSESALNQVLKRGYVDSDQTYFLWSPMPAMTYRDQITIDNIVAQETKNKTLRNRYSRFIKINLTKLCDKHYGRIFQRDPTNLTSQMKWMPLSLMDAADLAQREDLWFAYEPGNDVYNHVNHGSIDVPSGKIPKDCLELDREASFPSRKNARQGDESSDDERDEQNFTVLNHMEYAL